MPADFLTPERKKKIQFFGITDSEKIQKNFIVNNLFETLSGWSSRMVSSRGSWRAHISPEEDLNFPGKDY